MKSQADGAVTGPQREALLAEWRRLDDLLAQQIGRHEPTDRAMMERCQKLFEILFEEGQPRGVNIA